MSSEGSRKAVLYALAANGGIALSKTAAAAFTGSSALFAEAVHSFADCANQLLLMVGFSQAHRAPDANHPMGHGRVVYFWSMLVALLLFGLGGVVSVLHGWHALHDPHPVEHLGVSVVVLLVAVALESWSLRGALQGMAEERGDNSLWKWFKETRQSELLVVTGEDIAALLGLILALIALVLTGITGNPLFDALGSIAVGVLLVVISLLVLREVKGLVVGESASPEQREEISAFLAAQPEVAGLFNVITLQFGADVMVAVKARMAPAPSADAMIDAINVVEERLQQRFPKVRWVFFEPDVR